MTNQVTDRVRALLVAAAFSMLAGAAACASEGDNPPGAPEPSTDEPSTDETSTDGTGPGGTGGDTADDEGGDPGDGGGEGGDDGDGGGEEGDDGEGDVLGTATAELPSAPGAETAVAVRLDVVSLERLDGMVEMRVVLTHEGRRSAPAWEPGPIFDDPRLPDGEGENSLSGAALVDADDQRAYLPMIDSDGACLCSQGLDAVSVAAGDSVEVYADVGGVPDDVDHLDVQVPGFETVAQVAIR